MNCTPKYLAVVVMLFTPIALHAQGGKGKVAPMTAEQCTAFRLEYHADSAMKGVKPAEVTRMVTLPKAPADDIGKAFEMKVLVNPRGAVDSVRVGGTVSLTYEERLRVTALRWTFRPATYQGCAVPFWMSFDVTP